MVKAPCCEKIGLKRGKWTDEEDELLVKYIQANGEGSWRSLPKNAGLLRCGKSCRLRWTNYLRPNLKRGKFTAEEDETIVKLHGSLGNRWSLIAQHLSGRTDNEIKNYWNSNLRRRIYIFRNLKELIKTNDGDCDESLKKRDTTARSKRGSIRSFLLGKDIVDDIGSSRKNNSSLCHGSKGDITLLEGGSREFLLPEDNNIVDRGSTRENDSSCLGGKDGATWSEGDSIEFFLPKNCTVDIGLTRKNNLSCLGGKDGATWSEGDSIEFLLPKNCTVDIGLTRKNDLSCLGGKDGATWSEGDSIEFLLPKICTVDIGLIQKSNSSCSGGKDVAMCSRVGSIESLLLEDIENNSLCLGGRDDATWSEEGGLFESRLLENLEINSSYPRSTNNATWSEGDSIESFLLESYIVDISSNRETNSSCLGSKDEAIWFEEGSSIESLLMENYIADLGLAMQQHEHHAKLETHEPREEEEDKNNKDIHVISKQQQVCNGVWTFEEQGQQIQGPHEQNKVNEIVLLQQHNDCVYNFDNNWSDINFDFFVEEENGV